MVSFDFCDRKLGPFLGIRQKNGDQMAAALQLGFEIQTRLACDFDWLVTAFALEGEVKENIDNQHDQREDRHVC